MPGPIHINNSVVYVTNCPTRCYTKKSIYYSARSLYMFRVSTTATIRSTQNCNYSLRYCAATPLQRGQVIIRSTQNCNYSLRYCAATSLQRGQVIIRSTQNCNYSLQPTNVPLSLQVLSPFACAVCLPLS